MVAEVPDPLGEIDRELQVVERLDQLVHGNRTEFDGLARFESEPPTAGTEAQRERLRLFEPEGIVSPRGRWLR
jgi:hypothetical protein